MKRVLQGVVYDTDAAEEIAFESHRHELSDAWWRLYRTSTGVFFEVAARASSDFLAWCAERVLTAIEDIHPIHVAGWIEERSKTVSSPTVKQGLATLKNICSTG